MVCLILTALPYVVALVFIEWEKWTSSAILFSVVGFFVSIIVTYPNSIFLLLACNETRRRNAMMKMLTSSLELEFMKKDPITVRLPTINFLCP